MYVKWHCANWFSQLNLILILQAVWENLAFHVAQNILSNEILTFHYQIIILYEICKENLDSNKRLWVETVIGVEGVAWWEILDNYISNKKFSIAPSDGWEFFQHPVKLNWLKDFRIAIRFLELRPLSGALYKPLTDVVFN